MHSDRYRLDTPEKMCGALLVVAGRVKVYLPSRWNTPTGERPSGLDDGAVIRKGYQIFTPFIVVQTENLRDRRPAATVTEYRVVGGSVASDNWIDDAFPRPTVGQHAVMVFVPSIDGVSGQLNREALVLFEAFTIDQQGNVLLKSRTVEQGRVSQPESRIPFGQLKHDLAVCA